VTTVSKLHTGAVRLVDRRTRVVEVVGPEPPGSRRPTDRELLFEPRATNASEYLLFGRPRRVGMCFEADGRRARFLVDRNKHGDALLDLLARYPKTPARPVRPYGPKGWLLEE
jgi:hypothetical protein